MLQLDNLIFDAWGRRFFDRASVTIPDGTKVGVVGRNGVGKSTLVKLIVGDLAAQEGDILLPKAAKIGSVDQEHPANALAAAVRVDVDRMLADALIYATVGILSGPRPADDPPRVLGDDERPPVVDPAGDVLDGARLRELLVHHRPERIFQLAAPSHAASRDELVRTNVMGTTTLLDSIASIDGGGEGRQRGVVAGRGPSSARQAGFGMLMRASFQHRHAGCGVSIRERTMLRSPADHAPMGPRAVRDQSKARMSAAIASPARRKSFAASGTGFRALGKISSMIRSFIVANALVGLLNAAVSSLVFWLLGIPYFYFIGVISGFVSLVPYLGVFLALLPPLTGAVGGLNTTSVIVIFATVVGLHVLTMNVLYPKIVGKRLRLNPLAVTLALLFWAWIWGAMGLILAVPIVGATKIICDYVDSLRGLGAWLGD